MSLEGTKVLVTGSTSGIGEAIAMSLSAPEQFPSWSGLTAHVSTPGSSHGGRSPSSATARPQRLLVDLTCLVAPPTRSRKSGAAPSSHPCTEAA